ncbi:hypothetical protein AJ88_19610 [Mesorhizobium amorphae CCBAU 01583]|nr:hypothetical protein AJ88_19610 [Mesorhizobium amorphae CCBAU 01583]
MRLADAGVDRFHARPAEQPVLRLLGRGVHFGERKIAAGVHVEQTVIGLDIGEELDAGAEFRIGEADTEQQSDGQHEHGDGEAHRLLDHGHVPAVAVVVLVMFRRLGEDRAQRRREDQRIQHRGRQRDDQRDRHVLHEIADDAGPEQQR